jgi:hypothetical protein
VEKELQSSLRPVEASGEPAPTVTAATSAVAPATSAPQLADPVAVSPISMENSNPSTGVVAATAGGVGAATAATVGATAITNKTNSGPTEASKELNASADTPAKTVLQEERLAAPEQQEPLDSRDVSPMSRVATKNHPEGSEAGPIVTDGVTSESVPAESTAAPVVATTGETAPAESKTVGSRPEHPDNTPNKRASFMDRLSHKTTSENKTPEPTTPAPASGAESQKKRRSFFGRIKDKLSMK